MPKNVLWLISGAVKTGVVFTPVTDFIHTVTGVVTAMQLYIHNLSIKTSSELIPRSTKIFVFQTTWTKTITNNTLKTHDDPLSLIINYLNYKLLLSVTYNGDVFGMPRNSVVENHLKL